MNKPEDITQTNGVTITDDRVQTDSLPASTTGSKDTYAAIDLGSNSFHLAVATPEGGSIRIIDSLRASVRLGAGLDAKKRISAKTEKMALDTLAQFAERLRDIPRDNIRIVGTNTLRRARNAEQFANKAFEILGKRIEIISGREEARLIYDSVARTRPHNNSRRLVIDIGGGSTELVTGSGTQTDVIESFNMGCVSAANSWFHGSKISQERFRGASIHAQLELQPMALNFIKSGWDVVYGCSGTIKATARMLYELELSKVEGEISWQGLKKLQKEMIKHGSVESLDLQSITKNRMQVIAGGISVLAGIMKTLEIKQIHVSNVALREGLIFDMLGRARHKDIQSHTVDNISKRFQVNPEQSSRVAEQASNLLSLASKSWKLDRDNDASLLDWAARLHEIGMSVAHTQYHKHGAYLLENADLIGFTRAEQSSLALMVRFHRRKFETEPFETLLKSDRERLLKLTTLLRLAVLMHRSRRESDQNTNHFSFKPDKIHFRASEDWLQTHPLTTADLEDESEHLENAGFELKISKT